MNAIFPSSRPRLTPSFPAPVQKSRGALVWGGGVLLLAVLVILLRPEAAEPHPKAALATVLPRAAKGWAITDEPLASTEGNADIVRKKLDYDDYVYRRYQNGLHFFDVYVGYWVPAKIPTSMVAAHVPDVCWVSEGWKIAAETSGVRVLLSRGLSRRGEWRMFTAPLGQVRYVWYWHVGGRGLDGDFGRHSSGWNYVKVRLGNMWTDFRTGAQEQYFIRVTSDQPLEDWQKDGLFHSVMDALGTLALVEEPGRR